MAAMLSRSQSWKVSDCELCFGGNHDSCPRQLLFLNKGVVDSFLTLSVVKCIRQNVLTSRKLHLWVTSSFTVSYQKASLLSSNFVYCPPNVWVTHTTLLYEREWWMAGSNKSMIQTQRKMGSLKLSPQEFWKLQYQPPRLLPDLTVPIPAKGSTCLGIWGRAGVVMHSISDSTSFSPSLPLPRATCQNVCPEKKGLTKGFSQI